MDAPEPRLAASGQSRQARWKTSTLFAISIVALVCASLFAGVMIRPAVERWRRAKAPTAGELALFLEHTAVDVRLGHAAPLAETLGKLAGQVKEPATKERLLGLWTESALQANLLADAATSEGMREPLVSDPAARNAIRLRRIGLAVAVGRRAEADELARPLLKGGDSLLADEARLRLLTAMNLKELRTWVASRQPSDVEDARRAGLAALRLLGDAGEAARLLGPLERAGTRDAGIYQALGEVYSKLGQPKEVARVSAALLELTQREDERARLVLVQANALARAGEVEEALATVEPLRRSRDRNVRQAARRARYELLREAGRLDTEVRSLRDPAERAFVALEIEHNYAEAVRLYGAAVRALPDSLEYAESLHEAERRRDLAERRSLYEQVLRKDPEDQATRHKLLAVLVGLGEADTARKWVSDTLQGRENEPDALVEAALALKRAGLGREAGELLEKAHSSESDAAKKQQLLFALGDLYTETRQEDEARRLYTSLATDGASAEIRERAVARLVTLLR